MSSDFETLVCAAFATDGPLAGVIENYVEQPAQVEYARCVARTLEQGAPDKPAVSVLEAETGTGKTLGYAIPVALWVALHRQRAVLSTYTVHLQGQLCARDGDLDTALSVTRSMTGRILERRLRLGLRNFVSLDRVEQAIEALPRSGRGQRSRERFLEWARSSNTRMISEFLESEYDLPEGVRLDDVRCRQGDSEESLAPYRDHLRAATTADIVVTNHATALLRVYGRMSLDAGEPFQVFVADEADRLVSAAESILSRQVPLSVLRRIGDDLLSESADTRLRERVSALTLAVDKTWSTLAGLHQNGISSRIVERSDRNAIENTTNELAQSLAGVLRLLGRRVRDGRTTVPQELMDDLAGYQASLEAFRSAASGEAGPSSSRPVIHWSDVRQLPSLQMVPIDAGRAFAAWLRERDGGGEPVSASILTSATIGDGREESLDSFLRSVGVYGRWRETVVERRRFEPQRFGHMSMVIMDPSAPHPSAVTDTGSDTNREWVASVSSMILDAASSGAGRVLVLTLSMRDTALIADALEKLGLGDRVLAHSAGTRLSEWVAQFRLRRDRILISASAWEGLNLPGMIQELVVTRLPIAPPDGTVLRVLASTLARAGYPEETVRRIVYSRILMEGRRRFRQGIGRGIRRANDRVRLWIGDPRFPAPGATHIHQTGAAFLSSVPKRFRERNGTPCAHEEAQIWSNGTLRRAVEEAQNPWAA